MTEDDLDYIQGQGKQLTDYQERSLFDLNMPGVMTAEQVGELPEFVEWIIKSGDFIARLKVG